MFGYVKFFKQTPLLITHPSVFKLLLLFPQQLFIQADRVPASHDVVGDDTAQRVGHNGDFPSFLLKLWVPRAEQCVQAVQLLLQPLDKLFEGVREEGLITTYLTAPVHTAHTSAS